MGNHRRWGSSTAWGIAGVTAIGVLVVGLSGLALADAGDRPAAAGSVPELPASLQPDEPDAVRAAFIGDSYTAGAGASSKSVTFPQLLSLREGWIPVNLGRGGTGYLTTASTAGCGLAYCPNYLEMIPDAVKANPDLVIVSGGRNDSRTVQAARDQIAAFYPALRSALPDARIVATSPLWDDEEAPAALGQLAEAVRSAVEAVGGTYVDAGQPFEGRADLISDDGIHPDDAGYALLVDVLEPLVSSP
ncbi:SGNH/GDSL hydrolase family protein [Clavibacter michiganensis]|nr:SGNH/GDSL hydrolase family protein [Clavibacter michiganensis]